MTEVERIRVALVAIVPTAGKRMFFTGRGWLKPEALRHCQAAVTRNMEPTRAAAFVYERMTGIPATTRS